MDGFTRNPIHTLDASHDPLARCCKGIDHIVHVNRDCLLLTLIQNDGGTGRVKHNENNAPVTLRKQYDFLYFLFIQESDCNPQDFPQSFVEGAYEAFYWSFVSMTTVG